ncbi:hypothetical protein BV25DRAFT_1828014 [Artomyces pyxidatus]|uniref:Uncharacterized protein n=1 Tax=Artomyces pyxidatus TaxID=48021 RepID=A0ACB8SW97_9AGAM|nr:hypothetical protein BV25DRAFT_1828014 [Artomyces pyxidatus]
MRLNELYECTALNHVVRRPSRFQGVTLYEKDSHAHRLLRYLWIRRRLRWNGGWGAG